MSTNTTPRKLSPGGLTKSLSSSNILNYEVPKNNILSSMSVAIFSETLQNSLEDMDLHGCCDTLLCANEKGGTKQRPLVAKEVEIFLKRVLTKLDINIVCGVMAMVYLDRMRRKNLPLLIHNWRRLVFVSILMAEKAYEDTAIWNVDYSDAFPEFKLRELNRMEIEYLKKIDYKLMIKSSEYERCYFQLTTFPESFFD